MMAGHHHGRVVIWPKELTRDVVVEPLLQLGLELRQKPPREVLEGREGRAVDVLGEARELTHGVLPRRPVHHVPGAALLALLRLALGVLEVHDVDRVGDHVRREILIPGE